MKAVAGKLRSATSTQIRIAEALLESVAAQRLQPGDHITEASVAAMFGVSRSPVRAALAILTAKGVLEQRANRGYFVRRGVKPLAKSGIKLPQSEVEALSLTIARDWFCGRVPENFQESELRRRYGVGQLRFARVLLALAEDGVEGERITPVAGIPPILHGPSSFCAFAPRCEFAAEFCKTQRPAPVLCERGPVLCMRMDHVLRETTLRRVHA
ncbi:winged helix-turn-helix domain-containing protein [Mesorhizobium australicum]|uniref:Regulatory protein, gntR family n=1 Tax=Mesorhizobium australicum TaxID=536018 RepID=A0A1X7MP71_9HYPH|nr:winged helix-turn-helix domain-containing protein [Mesorhizobium australicum]SMH26495.1 regulatory protein, gntR family [Mesorhizobium australicum]